MPIASNISIAMSHICSAWYLVFSGAPDTTMYASPIVSTCKNISYILSTVSFFRRFICNTWHIIYIVMNYSILKHILYSLNRSACSIYLSNLHYNTYWWVLMYTNKLRHRGLCTNPRNKVSSHLNICISGKTLLVH